MNTSRITLKEALDLAHNADFLTLGRRAREIAVKKNGKRAAYLIDRNINYTNVCTARCNFCAFYRPTTHHKESYNLTYAEIDQKIEEAVKMGS
ncbi:MAG: dehypoxanthine futalosine cyclase, partial [Deltaproteobacteria bacterium]|nr:dehypoxanthine futalosine cyclase [Deltaproteobacteria bacterium]